jgi:hypothetical protein
LDDLTRAREGHAYDLLLDDPLSANGERLRDATAEVLADAERALKTADHTLTSSLLSDSKRSRAEDAIEKELGRYDEDYRSVTARSSAHQASLKTLADLESRRTDVAKMLVAQSRERESLGDPDVVHDELQAKLLERYSERSERLAQQCAALTELSDGLLRASLERGKGSNRLTSASGR